MTSIPCSDAVPHPDGCPAPCSGFSCYDSSAGYSADIAAAASTESTTESYSRRLCPMNGVEEEICSSSSTLPATSGLFVEAFERTIVAGVSAGAVCRSSLVETYPVVGKQLLPTATADPSSADRADSNHSELAATSSAPEEHAALDLATAPDLFVAEAEGAAAAAVSRVALLPCCFTSARHLADASRSDERQASGFHGQRRPLLELEDGDLVDIVATAFQPLLEWPRIEVQAMDQRLAAGLTPSGCAHPVTPENWTKVFAMILNKVELMGKHVLRFLLSCPGMEIIPKESIVKIASEGFYGMLLLLESPLYVDGESHLMLEDGSVFSRDWMRLSLEEQWLDAEHEFACHQAEINLSVTETALACLVHLLSCGSCLTGVGSPALDFIRERAVGALVFELNRSRVDAQQALTEVTALLDHLRSLTHRQAGHISKAFYEAGLNPNLCKFR